MSGALLTLEEVRRELRVAMAYEGIKMKDWAGRHGFSVSYVSAVLLGHKEPSERFCEALGIVKTVTTTYARKSQPKHSKE